MKKKQPPVWRIVAVTAKGRVPLKITDEPPTRAEIGAIAQQLVSNGFYLSSDHLAAIIASQVISIAAEPEE